MEKRKLTDKKSYLVRHDKPKAVYHNDWVVAVYHKEHECFNLNPTIHFKHISKVIDFDDLVKRSCQCENCTEVYLHRSDCSVHNEPAEPNGNCDCKSFEDAVKPLMKWMAENTHPHTTAIVKNNCSELVEGLKSVVTDEFIID